MNEDLQNLIDAYINDDLTEAQAKELSNRLRSDDSARELFLQLTDLHASLAVNEDLWSEQPVTLESNKVWRLVPWAIAACLATLVAVAFWPQDNDSTFVTMAESKAAFWESGQLPTAEGSRLGEGTLRLAEGMATLKFDSGATVVLEAPATLTLIDAMNCELSKGTAVSDIPDSALGFRVITPSADVVDYGTKFAVSVYEGTGETHTQVIEGKVQVEYDDKIIELNTGQRNTVNGKTSSESTDGDYQEHQTLPIEPLEHGKEWIRLESSKDIYTGRVKGHESEVLLYVKNAINGKSGVSAQRESYLGFELPDITGDKIEEAELLLFFAPTGWGLASHVPDATFSVYGMTGDVPDWDESILFGRFPGNPTMVHLGSFVLPQGVQKGHHSIRTDELADFLRQHSGSEITFKVVRDTKETENAGLVHGFASRRHPILPAPTLAIKTAESE